VLFPLRHPSTIFPRASWPTVIACLFFFSAAYAVLQHNHALPPTGSKNYAFFPPSPTMQETSFLFLSERSTSLRPPLTGPDLDAAYNVSYAFPPPLPEHAGLCGCGSPFDLGVFLGRPDDYSLRAFLLEVSSAQRLSYFSVVSAYPVVPSFSDVFFGGIRHARVQVSLSACFLCLFFFSDRTRSTVALFWVETNSRLMGPSW